MTSIRTIVRRKVGNAEVAGNSRMEMLVVGDC
jgi:hypothetical protein